MSTELKPCPFCGSDNLSLNDADSDQIVWVDCYECGESSTPRPRDDAIAAWNRRAATPAQPVEGWISVEDRLPKDRTRVIALFPAESTSPMDALFSNGAFISHGTDRTHAVTHWMDFPAAPQAAPTEDKRQSAFSPEMRAEMEYVKKLAETPYPTAPQAAPSEEAP